MAKLKLPVAAVQPGVSLNESISSEASFYSTQYADLSEMARYAIEKIEEREWSANDRQDRLNFLERNSQFFEIMLDPDELEEFIDTGYVAGHGSAEVKKVLANYRSNRYNNESTAGTTPPPPDFRPSSSPLSGTATNELGEKSGTTSSTEAETTSVEPGTKDPTLTKPSQASDSLDSAKADPDEAAALRSELLDLRSLLSSLQSSVDRFSTTLTPPRVVKREPTQSTSAERESLPSKKKRSKKRPAGSQKGAEESN
jgi:hypothetical protein